MAQSTEPINDAQRVEIDPAAVTGHLSNIIAALAGDLAFTRAALDARTAELMELKRQNRVNAAAKVMVRNTPPETPASEGGHK
jgi:hypothetical protein